MSEKAVATNIFIQSVSQSVRNGDDEFWIRTTDSRISSNLLLPSSLIDFSHRARNRDKFIFSQYYPLLGADDRARSCQGLETQSASSLEEEGNLLAELFNSVLSCCNDILSITTKSSKPKSFAILHTTSYPIIKQKYNLHSQILVDCIHQVWENLKTNPDGFKQVPVRFNIPRSGKFAETKRGNPVVVFSVNGNGRTALPIRQDGAYKRFVEDLGNGWKCTQF